MTSLDIRQFFRSSTAVHSFQLHRSLAVVTGSSDRYPQTTQSSHFQIEWIFWCSSGAFSGVCFFIQYPAINNTSSIYLRIYVKQSRATRQRAWATGTRELSWSCSTRIEEAQSGGASDLPGWSHGQVIMLFGVCRPVGILFWAQILLLHSL